VDHNGMAVHLTKGDWRVLRSAVYPLQWKGLMSICCGMAVKMKALKVKMVTVTVIG